MTRGATTVFIHAFRQRCQELSVPTATTEAVDALLRRLCTGWGCPRYHLLAQPVTDTPLLPQRHQRKSEVRQLPPGDPALEQLPRTHEQLTERFASGGICLAAFEPDSDGLLGFIWLLFGPYREAEHRCTLYPPETPPCALDVDIYIRPEARGSLVFAQLWQAANELLLSRGVQWSVSRVSAFNNRSLRAHQRLGAQIVGTLQYLQLGPLELLFASCPPYFSWSRPQGPAPAVTV
ncbi:MAG: N-acetyltransferase family protein, partial [Halorhodospira sp.]